MLGRWHFCPGEVEYVEYLGQAEVRLYFWNIMATKLYANEDLVCTIGIVIIVLAV